MQNNGTISLLFMRSLHSSSQYLLSLFLSPPGPPDIPVITQLQANTTSISLSWEEPPDNNAPILRYDVTLEVVDDVRGNTPLVFTTASNTTELSLDGLTPFTVYSVQVVAVNSVGSSASSVPMTVMTAEGSEST